MRKGSLTLKPLIAVAQQFQPGSTLLDVREYGSGNVNDTYLVTSAAPAAPFILQRINTHVFRYPELVMLNMCAFTEHVQARLEREASSSTRPWRVPQILYTAQGENHYLADDGTFWRALSFISGAQTHDRIKDADHAQEVGYALGRFQSLISDLPIERLRDTLEGFHITPRYLRHYDQVLAHNGHMQVTPELKYCQRFVQERRRWACVLEDATARNELNLRPIHGDPKVNNIMIDQTTGQAVSMIDLDTVKPGLVHYDIGDCLRSSCNPLGEETNEFDAVRFDTDLCQAILQGYLPLARDFLNESDCAYLLDAIRLIPFELGLRFLTDYLQGNVYFKTRYEGHNLCRAVVQFNLAASVESQQKQIRAIIEDLM